MCLRGEVTSDRTRVKTFVRREREHCYIHVNAGSFARQVATLKDISRARQAAKTLEDISRARPAAKTIRALRIPSKTDKRCEIPDNETLGWQPLRSVVFRRTYT